MNDQYTALGNACRLRCVTGIPSEQLQDRIKFRGKPFVVDLSGGGGKVAGTLEEHVVECLEDDKVR